MEPVTLSNQPYTPLFCEENIWHLARRMIEEGVSPNRLRVLFFSNPDNKIAMLNQLRGGERGDVIWDYHVVLEVGDQIYDFDSTLQSPVDINFYFDCTFPAQERLPEEYRSWVRCIPASSYLVQFYSDRSHMRGVIDEKAFPAWPAITPEHNLVVTLLDYLNMQKMLPDGSTVMRVEEYLGLREFLNITD